MAQDYCHFARLPRELRDRIYDYTCVDTTSLVLLRPTLFTQVLFSDLPELSLLRVCHQLREEVLLSIARRTSATTLDAWDCHGAYDPLQRRDILPEIVLEGVGEVEIILPTWSPTRTDLELVEAVLNYVRGVQQLTLLFNNPSLAQVKIQELKSCQINRVWNASTRRCDLHFRRSKALEAAAHDDNEQNEEQLRRLLPNDRRATRFMVKGYVSARWDDQGVYIPGHYAGF